MLNELKIPMCEHSRDPLVSCALEGVASIIAGIEDVAIVIHSPQGCSATVAQAYDSHEIDFTKRKIACSRLFETDIIMGATQKLTDLILEADKTFRTRVLFVVGTCAADIIGEDIEAICRGLQKEVGARLIPVMAGGFRGDAYAGMDLGLRALLPFIKTPQPSAERGKATVNLLVPQASLNPTWWADVEWVSRIFFEMGIGLCSILPRESSLTDLADAGEARANVLLSHDAGYEFAKALETRGIPLILEDLPLPIGIENTNRWLRAAGDYFGVREKAEEIILRGESRVIGTLRKRGLMIIPRYQNCRVAISADATIGIPLVRALYLELEMIPELLLFRGEAKDARDILERELDELGIHPAVLFNADGWAIKEALRNSEIDAILGSSWEKYLAEELGIKIVFDVIVPTNRDLYIKRSYFGYDGYLNLLEAMANDWEEALRSKRIAWEQFETV